jgi:RimJ/RimL family protein N-acetyltransferase
MIIREASVEDAESLLHLMHRLDRESKFMLIEPDERKTTLEEQRSIIESFASSDSKAMLVACEQGSGVGFVLGIGNAMKRNRHSMYCVTGVRESAAGRGIGTRLMTELETWALQHGYIRMELTVMCYNERARRLYLSRGFEIEGRKRCALMVDGEYVDEYYMAKLLEG